MSWDIAVGDVGDSKQEEATHRACYHSVYRVALVTSATSFIIIIVLFNFIVYEQHNQPPRFTDSINHRKKVFSRGQHHGSVG